MHTIQLGAIVAMACMFSACAATTKVSKKTSGPLRVVAPPVPGSAPAFAAAPTAGRAALLRAVPADAGAVMVFGERIVGQSLDFMHRNVEMSQELSEYMRSQMGVDLTRVQSAVLYAGGKDALQQWAVFLQLPAGSGVPKGRSIGRRAGVELVQLERSIVAAAIEGGVLVGTLSLVEHTIDEAHSAPEAHVSTGGFLPAWLVQAPDADILVAVDLQRFGDVAPLAPMTGQLGARRALLSYETAARRLRLIVGGDAEKLRAAANQLKTLVSVGMVQLALVKKKAISSGSHGEALAAIVAYHLANGLWAEIAPRMEGDVLVSEVELPETEQAQLSLALGTLAAVSIPAYVKYQRKAKAAEAQLNLTAIGTALRRYHASRSARVRRRGGLPKSVGWTPSAPCCTGGARKCSGGGFHHPTWRALGFALNAPHHFQYRFTRGPGPRQATIEARADLDCDGAFSSYRLDVRVQRNGELEIVGPTVADGLE